MQTFTGGNPPLLLDGARAFQDNGSTLFAGHAARTMAGRTADGSTMLVTVDASAGHIGMTMVQAMDLMRSLGAVDALNMDGGGSSTFFLRRWVANLPSGGGERSVATAVTIVANRWS